MQSFSMLVSRIKNDKSLARHSGVQTSILLSLRKTNALDWNDVRFVFFVWGVGDSIDRIFVEYQHVNQ